MLGTLRLSIKSEEDPRLGGHLPDHMHIEGAIRHERSQFLLQPSTIGSNLRWCWVPLRFSLDICECQRYGKSICYGFLVPRAEPIDLCCPAIDLSPGLGAI